MSLPAPTSCLTMLYVNSSVVGRSSPFSWIGEGFLQLSLLLADLQTNPLPLVFPACVSDCGRPKPDRWQSQEFPILRRGSIVCFLPYPQLFGALPIQWLS